HLARAPRRRIDSRHLGGRQAAPSPPAHGPRQASVPDHHHRMIPMRTLRSCLLLLLLCVPLAQAQTRSAALPDFTSLMKKQGPAVVNVTATRKSAAPGPTASAGGSRQKNPNQGSPRAEQEDPMLEFFRRFLPD